MVPITRLSIVLIGLSLFSGLCYAEDATTTSSCIVDTGSRGWRLAQRQLIVDTHIDVPYRLQHHYEDVSLAAPGGNFDFPRAVCGGLDGAFMSIYIPAEVAAEGGGYKLANELIDSVEAIVANAPNKFALAYTTEEVMENTRKGQISLPMGMENGSGIGGDLSNLEHFYDRGIRYITLAHSKANKIADSSYDENRPNEGLSTFGVEVVKKMNRLGIMVDVSHITDAAIHDVLKVTNVPVIASHSSLRYFTPGFERNLSDELVEAIATNGGVVQINFGSTFLTADANGWSDARQKASKTYLEENGLPEDSPEAKAFNERYAKEHPFPYADLSVVLDHIDRVVELVGVEHVGLGSDFDGVGNSLPMGLKDVSDYPNLVDGLLKRSYTAKEIKMILGGNLMRVWRATEAYAASQ